MTRDQAREVARGIANEILDVKGHTVLVDLDVLGQALFDAVQSERESCAKVAESLIITTEWVEGYSRCARHPSPSETAQAIRSRGEANDK